MTSALWRALEASWPAAHARTVGPWLIREGRGGGKRVSSASATGAWQPGDLPMAEAAMCALGQRPLFQIRPDQDAALDLALAARGYDVVDPVLAYAAPAPDLAVPAPPPLSAFAIWPPLAICTALWAEGGITGERLAIMARAPGPKAALLARAEDRPVGVAFVALSQDIAAVHALVIRPGVRRQGHGQMLLRAAAGWAVEHGASRLALLVTAANLPARGLYASLGMEVVGQYHYRQAPEDDTGQAR